jgi:hypothetical protein
MLTNFKKGLMDTRELTPNKLKALCEVDWPTFGEDGLKSIARQNCG